MSEKRNGSARFTDYDSYLSWYSSLETLDAMDAAHDQMRNATEGQREGYKRSRVDSAVDEMFQPQGGYGGFGRSKETAWKETCEAVITRIQQFHLFSDEYGQPLKVGAWEDGKYAYLYLGNPDKGIIVPAPEKYLEYIPEVDLSDVTPAELRAQLSVPMGSEGSAIVPADQQGLLTGNALSAKLEENKSAIDALEQQKEDIRNARSKELAGLKAQIDALQATLEEKKQNLMAQLEEKMAEMEAMKESLENQIFLLDSQLYAIRCYAGEVVKFAHIRKGKNAPNTEPIVIYQKLRFLDEDLGRIASLYELQWDKLGMFESFLQHHPLALETFAPNDRCVMLVRLSRTGRTLGRKEDSPYSNMLEDYDYYHGRTVGIVIRNGENVYLGWTDEDRVHISDDLIISRVITEVTPDEPKEFHFESDRKRYEKAQKEARKQIIDGIISRAFVYNILQGIVDNSPLLPLPEGVKLSKQSEYVIYSMADKSLTDNRFGSFTNILALCNKQVHEGDQLLTIQHLVPERDRSFYGGWRSDTWQNTRGRGDRNRTHDCSVEDCKLYKANVVEYDEPEEWLRYRYEVGKKPDGSPKYAGPYCCRADNSLDPEVEILERYTETKRHVFVSVPKASSGWRTGTESRSNFELYNNEFVNLTYMNSVWLEWVITNNKLGGWTIGGKVVDYAYAIRYLKKAMDYIRQREEQEKAFIDTVDPKICKDPDWPLKLTQWKLDKQVRTITEYQAKRFAKAYPNLDGKINIKPAPNDDMYMYI